MASGAQRSVTADCPPATQQQPAGGMPEGEGERWREEGRKGEACALELLVISNVKHGVCSSEKLPPILLRKKTRFCVLAGKPPK